MVIPPAEDPVAVPPVDDPVVAPPTILNQLAEDASLLLELFSRGSHDNNIISDEHQTIITNATAAVANINAQLRQANRPAGLHQEVNDDPDCIICFAEAADTVFMPCKHLVVCTVRMSYATRRTRLMLVVVLW